MRSWKMESALLLGLVVVSSEGCGSQAEQRVDKPAASATADPLTTCVKSMTRARQCTDSFIPTLVAARVRLDRPPGIAKADMDDGREPLIDGAKQEWAQDSRDEVIASRCETIAKEAPRDMISAVNGCMAKDSCEEYAQCYVAVIEPTL